MRPVPRVALVALVLVSACSRPAPRFSLENARAHVQMLAGTIGSRPIGTPENQRARQYVVDQLRLFGYDVRVQEVDARRPDAEKRLRLSVRDLQRPGPRRELRRPDAGEVAFELRIDPRFARLLFRALRLVLADQQNRMIGATRVVTRIYSGRAMTSSLDQPELNIQLTVDIPEAAQGRVPMVVEFGFPEGFRWPGPPRPPEPGPTSGEQLLAHGFGYAVLVTGSVQADNGGKLGDGDPAAEDSSYRADDLRFSA